MAAENQGGLPRIGLDMSKLPLYGQDDERLTEINQAQKDAIDALKKRYEQPNYWKVAAGFAKPQLGGFLASLGSAAEAMGENEEQRRASELPIAQMRLELAQSNMLLGASKKVNDMLRNWAKAHPGETPPASLIREMAATSPDNPTVKALQAELENTQKNQTLALQRIQQKQAAGMPLNQQDKEYLSRFEGEASRVQAPEEGATAVDQRNVIKPPVNAPSNVAPVRREVDQTGPAQMEAVPSPDTPVLTDEMNKSVRPSGEKPTEPGVLPNGARVNEDAYKLHEQGIPILSNVRTQQDQEDLRDPNNPNFTRQGNPIGVNSKHLTGDAIDIDTKRLTEEHKRVLQDNGWYQPKWATDPKSGQYDPNHWERQPTQKVEAKEERYQPTVRMPSIEGLAPKVADARIASYQKSVEQTEIPYVAKMQNWADVMSGPHYVKLHDQFDRAVDMMEKNPKLAKDVFALVQNSPPLLAALDRGFAVHAGAFNANLSFPIEAFLKSDRPEEAKKFADEMYSYLINIGNANLKNAGIPLKGAQQEYLGMLKGAAHIDQQAETAYKLLLKDRANFDHSKDIYERVNYERPRYHNQDHSDTPYADIFLNSKYLKDLDKKYKTILETYNSAKLP
jgi:hypothetical protein